MAIMGIYRIDGPNGKVYIGSSKDIRQRWATHRSNLRLNKHHSPKLQNAWNKYGEDVFTFTVIQIIDDATKLLYHEQIWLDILFQALEFDETYNINTIAGSRLGTPLTEEHKRKIGDANKGKTRTEEHKRKLSEAKQGKKHSSKSLKSRKPISEETRRKLSAVQMGNTNSKGYIQSEEHKQKRIESRRKNKEVNARQ